MLINKDYDHPQQVRIVFHDSENGRNESFRGAVAMITFGEEQYQWHPNQKKGYADPDGPPKTSMLQAEQDTSYNLPAASVAVFRGRIVTPTR